jgi:hypothetical protein
VAVVAVGVVFLLVSYCFRLGVIINCLMVLLGVPGFQPVSDKKCSVTALVPMMARQ